jgi:mono/diheme cytochrome c family protein
VNKQIIYIIQAHVILAGVAGAFFLFSLFPSDRNNPEPEITIGEKQLPVLSDRARKGQLIFINKCQTCHHPVKEINGPALKGFEERGPWKDRTKLYEWIRNPALFMSKDSYTRDLKEKYGTLMSPFPAMTNEEIDLIAEYLMTPGN